VCFWPIHIRTGLLVAEGIDDLVRRTHARVLISPRLRSFPLSFSNLLRYVLRLAHQLGLFLLLGQLEAALKEFVNTHFTKVLSLPFCLGPSLRCWLRFLIIRHLSIVTSISSLFLRLDLLALLYLGKLFSLLNGILQVVLLELFRRFLRAPSHTRRTISGLLCKVALIVVGAEN